MGWHLDNLTTDKQGEMGTWDFHRLHDCEKERKKERKTESKKERNEGRKEGKG